MTEAWERKLRPASFRGVPFLTEVEEDSGGRRVEVETYPYAEQHTTEDMGGEPEPFTFQAYVIGADFHTQRDRLKAALRKPGPGTLVHPQYGQITVRVQKWTCRHRQNQQRMATFDLQFIDAGRLETPTGRADTASALASAATAAQDAAEGDFGDGFSVVGAAQWVVDAAETGIHKAVAAIDAVAEPILGAQDVVASFRFAVANLDSSVSNLLTAPAELAAGFRGLIDDVKGLVDTPRDAIDMYKSLLGFGDEEFDDIEETTPSREIEAANQRATTAVVRHLTVASMAAAMLDTDFDSADDALAVRDQVARAIDSIVGLEDDSGEIRISDEAYDAFTQLRAAVKRHVSATIVQLARLVSYTPADTEPVLVIAYNLYGSVDEAEAIVARNSILHPGFVPGGQPLQVLTDA